MRLKEADKTRTILRLLCPLLLAHLCCSLHKHAQVYVFMCSGATVRLVALTGAITATGHRRRVAHKRACKEGSRQAGRTASGAAGKAAGQ